MPIGVSILGTMSLDLNELLRDWPHEPGMIKVRKVLGADGREKLQLRIDLGLIQMEVEGRPDGQEPFECASLLEYHQGRAREAEKKGSPFTLDADEIGELQQEGVQYYHRYISLFQIQDYLGVIRDTKRNLEMFDFVARHAPSEELAWSVEQFTPYVLMMNFRAKATLALDRLDHSEALRLIEKGMGRIRSFYQDCGNAEMEAHSPELGFLNEWHGEVRAKQPLSKLEEMQRDLEKAIASEAYERAAELRDAIRALESSQ